MKHISLSILFTFSFLSIIAQDAYESVAKETCECIQKKDLSKLTKEQIQVQLGVCMIESPSIQKLDLDLSDAEAGRKMGEKVGVKMATICPKVFKYFIGDGDEEEASTKQTEGTIKKLTEGEFNYLTIKESNGREVKLIWLRYFKGSEELIENITKLEGRKVKIVYEDVECYSPQAKSYLVMKEIRELVFE